MYQSYLSEVNSCNIAELFVLQKEFTCENLYGENRWRKWNRRVKLGWKEEKECREGI